MNVKQFRSKLKIEELLVEIDKIERSFPLVENEQVQAIREHKAMFYYRIVVAISKQLNKECKILGQKLFIEDKIKVKELQKILLKNCSEEYQHEVANNQEDCVTID